MGFKVAKKLIPLKLPGAEWEGCEINVSSLPLGEYLEFQKAFSKFVSTEEVSDDDVQFIDYLLTTFANTIHSWNLEDENDKPIPATKEGLLSLDSDFVMLLMNAFMQAIEGVDQDLGKESNSGEISDLPEVNIPTEALLSSPVN